MHFTYYAKKVSGEEMKGVMDAKNHFDLAKILRTQNYFLVSCKSESESKKKKIFCLPSFLMRVSASEKIFFSRNLSVMISAGISVDRALEIFNKQTKNKKFKNIINSISNNIKKGNSLSESMKSYPTVFPPVFIAMVKAGEESGNLSGSLGLIAEQLERDYVLVKRIKGALIYPAIIISAMILIGILMFIYVVPTLVSTLKELGVELPLSTRIVIAVSDFFVHNLILMIIIAGLAGIIISGFFRSSKGKILTGAVLLRIPLISTLVKKINSSRTSRTLASLIKSGVNMVEALSITKDVIENFYFKKIIEQAKNDIQKGIPVSESFKKADKFYPILVGEMMAVGEETGKFSEMLLRLADFYEEEIAETTKNMSTIIEPILMIIIGAAVGFFAIAMIKPMYSMVGGL